MDYENSISAKRSRAFLLFFMCLQSFTCAGTIFGYMAVADALRTNGQYGNLCDGGKIPCVNQTLQFNKIYVIGVSIFFVSFAIYGYILDKFGPKIASIAGMFFNSLGTLIFALSDSRTFDAFLPALILIGAGAPGSYISAFHICQLFSTNKNIASSILVGSMVGSSLVYLSFANIIRAGVSHSIVFGSHFIWMVFIGFTLYFLQPSQLFTLQNKVNFHSYYSLAYTTSVVKIEDTVKEKNLDVSYYEIEMSERKSIKGHCYIIPPDDTPNSGISDEIYEIKSSEQIKVNDKKYDLKEALLSYEFLYIITFVNIHIFRFNFYLATALTRIDNFGADKVLYVNLLFILIPLLGSMSTLAVTYLIRLYGLDGIIWTAQILGLLYGILVMIPGGDCMIAVFVILSIHRMFLFSFMYPYVSIVFGQSLFGTLNGIILTSSGIVSLLQYALIEIAEGICDGDYFYVDLFMFPIMAFVLSFLPKIMMNVIHETEAAKTLGSKL